MECSCEYNNEQSRTTDKGWSPSLGVGRVMTTPHRKNLTAYETFHKASDNCGSGQGQVPGSCVQCNEL